MKKKSFIFALFLIFSSLQVKANNDFQQWSLSTLEGNFNEKFGYYLELQHRQKDHWSDPSLTIIRPALKFNLNKNASIYQGYDWFASYDDFKVEHRLWQQLLLKKQFNKLKAMTWLRLEERFLPDLDFGLRFRIRSGFRYPILNSKKWSFDFFDELFINLYDVEGGPQGGFDQNWIFSGLNYQFNQNAGLQIGYILNILDRAEIELQHGLRATLHFHF